MPMPQEYQRAGKAFDLFLEDARQALGHATRNQTYTTVQGVLLAFRRRLTVEEGLRFADTLPAVLRAIFVFEWEPKKRPSAFSTREAMTEEVRALRYAHNYSPPTAIADVARALRTHVDIHDFETTLMSLPPGALEFWSIVEGE